MLQHPALTNEEASKGQTDAIAPFPLLASTVVRSSAVTLLHLSLTRACWGPGGTETSWQCMCMADGGQNERPSPRNPMPGLLLQHCRR